MRLMILNGPNLNLLGVREPHIYGTTTLASIKASCEEFASFAGAQLSFHQSNHEGVLVDLIQSAREESDAIIINPAGYSFTSVAMLDALKTFEGPIFELHISNIHARDELHAGQAWGEGAGPRKPAGPTMSSRLPVRPSGVWAMKRFTGSGLGARAFSVSGAAMTPGPMAWPRAPSLPSAAPSARVRPSTP